jgi:archaellum component FlaF (FlaF/FlaG flagellin family)
MKMRAHTAAFVAALVAIAGAPVSMAQTVNEPAASTASQTGPRLTLSTETVDFGEVDDSGPVSTKVTITNEGDEVLEIGNIHVTCGCTAGEVGTKTLKPGESTDLTVNFDARNRSGQQHGKRVTIDSNDPTGAKSIAIDVWVLPRVVVEPGLASFGQVVQGESKSVVLSVKGMSTDFEVLSASVDREDAFSVKLLEPKVTEREHPRTGETIEVGESLIEVHMSDQARVGRIDGGIRIETNDPNSPVKTIRVTAVVAGDISAEPTRVSLAALTPGETFEETFKLVSARGKPFQIKKATLVTSTMSTVDRDQIEVSYEPIPKPEDENEKAEVGYIVTVKGQATDSMRIIQGSIVMLTDAEGQRVVRTPITGVVRAQNAAADQSQSRGR